MVTATPDIMIGFGADEGSSINKLSQIIEMFRKALFGVIYVMSKETSSSTLIIISGSVMQFFQILGFAFNRDRKFPLHPQAASALLNTLPFFTLAGWRHSSAPTKGGAIFVMALCTVIIVLACAVYVGYSFVQSSFKYMFPLKILRQFAVLITSIGFIPIATIFIQNIRCEIDPTTVCYTGTDINSLIFIVPVSILFVIFCFIVQLTYFEDDPCKPSVMGRCHSRAEVLALIMRFLLTAFWELMPIPKYNLFIIVAMSILTFVCAFVYTWYLPFYRQDICEIKSTLSWIQCWAAIVVTVAVLNDDESDPAPIVAFYIGIPIVIIASNLLLTARKIWIRDTPVQRLNSAFEVQLKVHLLMIKVAEAWKDNGKRDVVSEVEFNNVCRECEGIYLEGVKRFSNSSLIFLFRGQFYLTVLKHTHTGMRALAKAAERSPQLDEQFLIYRRQKKRSEENTGNASNDIITSIAYEQYLKDAIDNDWKAAVSQVRFWEDVQVADIKIEELNELAADVSRYLDRAQQNYQKMLKMSQRTPTALRTYAGFLNDLLNEKESAATILNQADEARNNVKQGEKVNGMDDSGDQSAVVVISVDDGSLGVITKVNDYLCKILGYCRNDLIGKNVSILVPHPWKLSHHNMIQSFLESGNLLLTKKFRRVFAEHKDGMLIPAELLIRENEDSDDVMEFLAVFTPFEEHADVDCNYIILIPNASGAQVLGYTRGCKYLFAEPHDIPEKIDLLNWIPFYNDIKSASGGFKYRVSPASVSGHVQIPKWDKTGQYLVEFSVEQRARDGCDYDILNIRSPGQLLTEIISGHIVHELISCTEEFNGIRESVIESLCSDFRHFLIHRRDQINELACKQLQGQKNAIMILNAMQQDANMTNTAAGGTNEQYVSAVSEASAGDENSEESEQNNKTRAPTSLLDALMTTGSTKSLYQVHPEENIDQDVNGADKNFRHLLSGSSSSKSMLLPRLRYIRRLLFLALFLSLITVIGSFVFIDYTIVYYNSSSSLLALASERPFHALSIVFATQWLLTIAAGIDSVAQISPAMQMLISSSRSLKDFNQIVRDNQADVSSQFLATEQAISVNLVIPSHDSSQDHTELASPVSATARLADAASQLYKADINSISLNNSNVDFIIGIQKGDLLSHFESATSIWRQEILNGLSRIQLTVAISALIAFLLLFLLIAAFVVPAMQVFMYNQFRGLMVFTQVPAVEIEMLRKRSLKRLGDLRIARSELFATSDHDDFTHDDDIRHSNIGDLQGAHRNLKALSARRKTVSLGWKLSLKLFSVVLTLLLFIAIVSVALGQATVISSMADNTAVQTWSQFRRMKIREVLLTLQTWGAPLNGTVFGTDDSRYSAAMIKLNELNHVDYSLTYGSTDLSLPGVFQDSSLSDTEAILIFRDGCLLDVINVTSCRVVEQGLLLNGLRVATSQFSSQIRSLITLVYDHQIHDFDPSFQLNTFANLRNLEGTFLQPALQYGIFLINSRLSDSVKLFQSRYLGVILVFTVFLLLLVLTLYEPTVKVLDLQAKHMRTMILCMPERVLQAIPNIDDIFDSDF